MSRIPQNIPCREARTSALTILGIETLEFQLPNEFRELQLLGAILVLNLQELKATHELHVWFVGLLYSRFCFWMYNIYYHYPIGPIHKICIHVFLSKHSYYTEPNFCFLHQSVLNSGQAWLDAPGRIRLTPGQREQQRQLLRQWLYRGEMELRNMEVEKGELLLIQQFQQKIVVKKCKEYICRNLTYVGNGL